MKILIISECTPRERVVVHEIIKNFDDVIVLCPDQSKRSNAPRKKKGVIESKVKKVLNKLHKISLDARLKEYSLEGHHYKKILFPHSELKNPCGLKLIKELKPDIILTCRAPILRDQILAIPKIGAINVHYGIPPEYRGNDTLFWALYNRDFDKIGACIHHINNGVDRGNILAKVFPSLEPKDDELSIDIKTTKLAAEASVRILQEIQRNAKIPVGIKQIGLGKNYKASQRTIKVDLKFKSFLKLGRIRPPFREKSISYYLNYQSSDSLLGKSILKSEIRISV